MRKKKEEIIEEEVQEDIKEEPKEIKEYYFARIGETLEDIAKKFGLDVEKLKELNGEIIGGNQVRLK
jgi:LysM repeat protein